MKPALVRIVSVALVSFATVASAQINPFRSNRTGPTLSVEDNRLLLASIDRLNTAEPVRPGLSENWVNPDSKSSGTSTVVRVFHAQGKPCHLIRHHIVVAGHRPANYQLTWCRTSAGEWKIK